MFFSLVFQYGAEMVESSVKTFSKPVMDRIDPRGSLTRGMDEWGYKTLERVGVRPLHLDHLLRLPLTRTEPTCLISSSSPRTLLPQPSSQSLLPRLAALTTAAGIPSPRQPPRSEGQQIMPTTAVKPLRRVSWAALAVIRALLEATVRGGRMSGFGIRRRRAEVQSATLQVACAGGGVVRSSLSPGSPLPCFPSLTQLLTATHAHTLISTGADDDDEDDEDDALSPNSQNALVPQQPPHQGSRWQGILVEAGMTAGGIGAAVSEESMKSLKYCLQWLQVRLDFSPPCIKLLFNFADVCVLCLVPCQYATAHLENRIHLLRNFIASLSSESTPSNALVAPGSLQTLSHLKADVTTTIRKVLDVVSKYAGNALPEPARNTVRGFVLSLPERWQEGTAQMLVPGEISPGGVDAGAVAVAGSLEPTVGIARGAAGRVLVLAVESLDMLQGCAQVFGESLERAEACVAALFPLVVIG